LKIRRKQFSIAGKRLYDAIENGVTDRAEGAMERLGPTITPQSIRMFARTARKPRTLPGALQDCGRESSVLRHHRRTKLVVHADADDLEIVGEMGAGDGSGWRNDRQSKRIAADADPKIFGLDRP
jgi:hypothetical protein